MTGHELPLQNSPIAVILILLLGGIIGIILYRFYQSRLIRYLPTSAPIRLEAFFCEVHHSGHLHIENIEKSDSLALKITNMGKESVHFESWFVRALNGRGGLRQLFQFPQNFVRTLGPKEQTTIEIQDLSFLKEHHLHTICLRDIYGREWEISRDQIINLKKDYFWQSIT